MSEPTPGIAPFDNCRFKMCDLPGQCISEGKCHHPVMPIWRNDPQCLSASFQQPGCAANRFKAHIAELERTLAAQRTALLALAQRARENGHQGIANEIEEIVK